MKSTFFPDKSTLEALETNIRYPYITTLLFIFSILIFILSLYFIYRLVFDYKDKSIAQEVPKKNTLFYSFTSSFLAGSGFLVINNLVFLLIRLCDPCTLYTRIFESIPINLYSLIILNLFIGVFYLIFSAIIAFFFKRTEEISKGAKLPILSGLASLLITIIIFYLFGSLFNIFFIANWIALLSLIIPMLTINLTVKIEKYLETLEF